IVSPSRCTRRVTSSPQVGFTWCTSASNGSRSPRPCGFLWWSRMMAWYIDWSCISGSTSHSSEELLGRANSVGEGVDVVVAGVHVERRAGRRRDAVAPDDRPRAVVPHPHGDAEVVEDLADVVRVDVL